LPDAALKQAIEQHQPQLANVNEGLETTFLLWCERHRLPIPQCNVWVHDELVDAYWPEYKLVVELDGGGNHSSPAQRKRDHRRDVVLRTRGITVLRYDTDLLKGASETVYADLTSHMHR
jgi:hypothetical protein